MSDATTTARRRLPADLGPRVAVAVPALAILLGLNHVGGIPFALTLLLIGCLGALELVRLTRVGRPDAVPGALPLTIAGIAWLSLCLGHAIGLRGLDDGARLVLVVLLATFGGDTAAQLAGSAFGRRKLAPRISPNKTVEGLLAGIVVGTALGAAYAALALDLEAWRAIVIALACALAAPAGDLLESWLKRHAGVKDSGRAFGAHGGVLDRIDAVVVAALVAFYAASGLT